jgi:hypothetical protein
MYDYMGVVEYSFVWCNICSPFFIEYGEDGVLVFFCGKTGLVYGFLCIFFVVRVCISTSNPFMFKGIMDSNMESPWDPNMESLWNGE